MRRILTVIVLLLAGIAAATPAADRSLVLVRTDEGGGRAVTSKGLMLVAPVPGGYLALLGADERAHLDGWGVAHTVVAAHDDPADAYIVQYDAANDHGPSLPPTATTLFTGEGYRIVRLPAGDVAGLMCVPHLQRVFRRPLRFVSKAWQEPALPSEPDADIAAIVAAVEQASLQSTVQTLQDFGTRHSQSAGGLQASYWIRDQFLSYGYADVVLDDYNSWNDNVVCTKTGAVHPDRIIVIGAHYDSINPSNNNDAPGADDNATGSTCVLTAARLFADHEFENTIVFITFSGEEEGLYGSEAWANEAAAQGLDIVAMVNLDMLAYRAAGDAADCDVVVNTASQPLREVTYDCAATYVPGFALVDGSLPLGASSDHASFWAAGFRAVMLFEDTGQYSPYIHTANDVIGTSANDFAFMAQNVKVALATTAALARPFRVAIVHTPLVHQEGLGPFPVTAQVLAASAVDPGSVQLHVRVDGGAFATTAMAPTGQPDEYTAAIATQPAGSEVEYYLTAGDDGGHTASSPDGAPAATYAFRTGVDHVLVDDAEADQGWSFQAPGDFAGTGIWVRADPVGTAYQPEADHTPDPGHICFVTGNGVPGGANGDQDVDGGATTLTSPVFDLAGVTWAEISYWRWYVDETSHDDDFVVNISSDGGVTWTNLETVTDTAMPWVHAAFTLPQGSIALTDQMRLRFVASDEAGASLVEALVDDVMIVATRAGGPTATGDTPAVAASLGAYPNPFNPRTTFAYTLPRSGDVTLRILDAGGREVARPIASPQPAGPGAYAWDAGQLPSGVYLARLELDGRVLVSRKLTLVR